MDESGTPPLADHDDIFVIGAVGAVGPHLSGFRSNFTDTAFFHELQRRRVFTSGGFVRPTEGFENLLVSKFQKANLMARFSSLLRGSEPKYAPARETTPRNWVWLMSLSYVVTPILVETLVKGPVSSVHIHADSKSLTGNERRFGSDFVAEFPKSLREVGEALGRKFDRKWREVMRLRAALITNSVSIDWVEKDANDPARNGISMVDRYCRIAYRACRDGRGHELATFLKTLGYQPLNDLTPLLMAPMSAAARRQWVRGTGLPEP